MFKILQEMIVDLGKLMVIWVLIIVMFSCVAVLLFGEIPEFQTWQHNIVFYFQTAIGSWSLSQYQLLDEEG